MTTTKEKVYIGVQSCSTCPDLFRKCAKVCDGMFNCLLFDGAITSAK